MAGAVDAETDGRSRRLHPAVAALFVAVAFGWCAPMAAAGPVPGGDAPVVAVKSGLVAGVNTDGLAVFKGIPFAAPPVGPLRWRPPRPPAPWSGVRPAKSFGFYCMQNDSAYLNVHPAQVSEDCLTLNVWSPPHAPGERLPVMVIIPGGGFMFHGSAHPFHDGAGMARRGIVVVSFNYRLGVFGFLAHPMLSKEDPSGASGAYGLLDQVAALEWVKANIAGFGGDPRSVTIYGESAGGSSVLYLMASPLAKGLFQRAISGSAGLVWFPMQHLREPAYGLISAEAEGAALGADIAALRAVPAAEMQGRGRMRFDLLFSDEGIDYWPIVDGHFLPDEPARLFAAGRAAHVPLLVGSNGDDGVAFAAGLPFKTAAAWRAYLSRRYPAAAGIMLAQYPVGNDGRVHAAADRWTTDWGFAGTAHAAATAVADHRQAAYLYVFTRSNATFMAPLGLGPGSHHSLDVPFVLGHMAPLPGQPDIFDAGDRALSETMMATWVRFIRTGDPNGPGLPPWPRYDRSGRQLMEFGNEVHVHEESRAAMDAFDNGFARLQAAHR
jgi:para-nitrobenzyl esterase